LTPKGLLYKHNREGPSDGTCVGAYREPREIKGDRGVCMACADNIGLMQSGLVRKHKSPLVR
jgi:hypothetical protein